MKLLDVPQSGSIAGVTSSRNRYGQYRRTRAIPVNPNSLAQQRARNSLSTWSAAWRGLTPEDQEAWNSFADGVTLTDSLGQSITLTGQAMFVRVNTVAELVGGDQYLAEPPALATFGLGLVTNIAITDTATVQVTHLATTTGQRIAVYCSPPLSPGRNFNADYRFLGFVNQETAGGDFEIQNLIEDKFGTLTAGQKYFVQTRTIINGQEGDRVTAFGVLVEA